MPPRTANTASLQVPTARAGLSCQGLGTDKGATWLRDDRVGIRGQGMQGRRRKDAESESGGRGEMALVSVGFEEVGLLVGYGYYLL